MLNKIIDSETSHFLWSLLRASILFFVIAFAALGLQLFVTFLNSQGASDFIITSFTLLEYLLIILDIIYICIVVIRHVAMYAIDTFKEITHASKRKTPKTRTR